MKILDIATTKNYEVEGIVLNKKTVGEVYEKFFKEKIENLINKKDNGFIIPYININGENAKNYSKEKLVNFFKENGFFEIHYLFGGDHFEICYTSNNYLCQLNDIFIKDPFLESLNLEAGYQQHFKSLPINLNEKCDMPKEKYFCQYYEFENGKYYKTKENINFLEINDKNIEKIIKDIEYLSIKRYFINMEENIQKEKNVEAPFSDFIHLKKNKFEYEVNNKKYFFTNLDEVCKNLIEIFKKEKYLNFPNKLKEKNNLLDFKQGNYLLFISEYNNNCFFSEIKYISKELFGKYLEKN